jgi:UbiD family decarboxylase
MDDKRPAEKSALRPPRDFHEHLAALDAAGLLVKIDRPINKDTQLQPLVRWQFIGGIPEDDRRAFMFTNVVDSKGKRYDMPVVLGALASSPRIYAMGMGQTVEGIGPAWLNAVAHPIPPVVVAQGPCQEIVITGDELRQPGGGLAALPVPISTPGYDAAPYLTATLCVTVDPDTGVQNTGMYRAALKATDRLVVRMVARPGGAGGWVHWQKYRDRKERMPISIALGGAPVVVFTSPQKLTTDLDEYAVAGALAGAPIEMVKCKTNDLLVPAN